MRIQLLGRFSIRLADADERLIPVPSRRRRALLAYLAMQPGFSETRERLATLLWGDVPDRQARQSLRQALVAMRADFAPFDVHPLRVERDIIGLDPDLIVVDARELLALHGSERLEDVENAAAVFQGPFLDGIDLPAEGFADWLRQQRHRIDAAAATVLARGAEQADKSGNGPLAIHFAERLSALDPARGSSHRLLLKLSARYQGRDYAIARADSLNKALRDQFDVGLDAETRNLIAEIKAGEYESARTDDLPRGQDTDAAVLEWTGLEAAPLASTSCDVDGLPTAEASSVWPRRKHPVTLLLGVVAITIGAATILSSALGWPRFSSHNPRGDAKDPSVTQLINPEASGDPTLDELLTRGWAAMVRLPSEGPAASPASYFEQALKRAPDNASAQLGFAGSQIVLASMLVARTSEFDLKRADQFLKLVLERDPHQGTALLYRGMLRRFRGDYSGSRDDLLTAIQFHPSYALAYAQLGYTFYRMGEYDRGLEYVRYAIRLSPHDPSLGAWSSTAGMIELERGNDAAAYEWLDRAVTLAPRQILPRLALAAVLIHRGDAVAAHRQVEELSHIAPWLTLETVRSRLGLYSPPAETRRRLLDGAIKALAAG
jgi:DNA-binding SARP family transcriptional activator/tetratricopeptide (TPR) repeat protein